jgi:pimeloyl-ACP methyl ester carboxylesterase
MGQFAADALCLLDSLGVSQAFVLGLSMGGMIAQELAVLAPDRIRALFLGCTHCGGTTKIPPSPDVLRLLVSNDGLDQRQIIEKNLPLFFSTGFLKTRPEAIDDYIEAQLQAPLQPEHAFAAQLAAIRTFDLCGRSHQVTMPTLIVTGTEDILVPPGNARLLAERIPHSSVVELPGAGHAIHVEQRDRLNDLALDFFRKHSA